MGTFRTSLGDEYVIERRLPRLAWRPRYRGADADGLDLLPGFDADDPGILAVIGLILFVIVLAIIVVPFLLFVAEVALVIAIVIPVVLIALALGVVTHTVLLRRAGADGAVLEQRAARGPLGSAMAARELRAKAEAGLFRSPPPTAPVDDAARPPGLG